MGKLAVLIHETKGARVELEDIEEAAREAHAARMHADRADGSDDALSWARDVERCRRRIVRGLEALVDRAQKAAPVENGMEEDMAEVLRLFVRVGERLADHVRHLEAVAWERARELARLEDAARAAARSSSPSSLALQVRA